MNFVHPLQELRGAPVNRQLQSLHNAAHTHTITSCAATTSMSLISHSRWDFSIFFLDAGPWANAKQTLDSCVVFLVVAFQFRSLSSATGQTNNGQRKKKNEDNCSSAGPSCLNEKKKRRIGRHSMNREVTRAKWQECSRYVTEKKRDCRDNEDTSVSLSSLSLHCRGFTNLEFFVFPFSCSIFSLFYL
jgi:hypothetical protein